MRMITIWRNGNSDVMEYDHEIFINRLKIEAILAIHIIKID